MRKTPTEKKSRPFFSIWTALVLLVVWLLAGCETPPRPLPPAPVPPVQIPPLPQYARQPVTPSECLPTCSDALMSARESWRILLTGEALPAEPASEPTTKPTKP